MKKTKEESEQVKAVRKMTEKELRQFCKDNELTIPSSVKIKSHLIHFVIKEVKKTEKGIKSTKISSKSIQKQSPPKKIELESSHLPPYTPPLIISPKTLNLNSSTNIDLSRTNNNNNCATPLKSKTLDLTMIEEEEQQLDEALALSLQYSEKLDSIHKVIYEGASCPPPHALPPITFSSFNSPSIIDLVGLNNKTETNDEYYFKGKDNDVIESTNFLGSAERKRVEEWLKKFLRKRGLNFPTPEIQKTCYLGNQQKLLDYLKNENLNTMTTAQVRAWLKNNPDCIPPHLNLDDCDIDHVIAHAFGGVDHPFNYVIMPKSVNRFFKEWLTPVKFVYVGHSVARTVKAMSRWVKETALKLLNFNAFADQRLQYYSDEEED